MPLDRYRMTSLMELSELERRVTGTERQRLEENVALLIKAAYDDASDAARAEFVRRARQMVSAWPWAAVQAADGQPPAVLVLLRGQVPSADIDRGNQIPNRGRPEATVWAPLYAALDTWDTATIKRWITPQGWAPPAIRIATVVAPVSRQLGGVRPGNGGGVRPGNGGGAPPDGGTTPGNGGVAPPTPPDAAPPAAEFSWRHPAVIAAGATMLTTLGVALYSLGQNRGRALPVSNPSSPEATKP